MNQHISETTKTSINPPSLAGKQIALAAVNSRMITNFGRYVALELTEQGADLHVYASGLPIGGWSPRIDILQDELGAQFHGLPLPQYFAPFHELWCLILLTIYLRRHRIQLIHTRGSVMGAIGKIAAKLAGVPVIVHGQDDLYSRDSKLSPLSRQMFATLEKYLGKLADRSFFISQVVLDDAIRIGFPPERCILVGLDLHEVFQIAADEADGPNEPVRSRLLALGIPEDAKIVGCIARMAYLKGHDIFIDAVKQIEAQFPDWVFLIKGNGPLREELAAKIEADQLQDRIFMFTEELEFEDLPVLYRCLDVFALPTRREGFGMVFAEAMAMGKPVVGPRIAPITEVVPADCGVLVDPENSAALAGGLSQVMQDAQFRQMLAQKGREHALTTWANRRAARTTLAIYRQLLEQKNVR